MPPKRGNKYGDTDSSGSTIKKIKVVRGGEDEDGNGVMCDICSQILKSAGSLARHMEAVHGDGGEKFICNDCGEIQDTARKLKSHRRKHKTFVCEKCNNSFSLRNKQRHIKLCKGSDTMKRCDECDFETKYQSLLDRHKNKHSSFVCDDCGKILTFYTIVCYKCPRMKLLER